LLDVRAETLSEDMLVSVAYAIADIVNDVHLKEDYIIPKANDPETFQQSPNHQGMQFKNM
jgi:malic enzyme